MDARIASFDAAAVVQALMHFVWQGMLVWTAAVALLWIVRPRQTQTRYAIYCATMLVLAACPLVTFGFVCAKNDGVRLSVVLSSGNVNAAPAPAVQESPYVERSASTGVWSPQVAGEAVRRWFASQQSMLLACWAVGAACYLLRVATGSLRVWQIARRGLPLPAELQISVERLGRRMGFRNLPIVRVVDEISQAVAVGVVRPMVLLPAAWVSGLSGELLEAVIAHELAHLRRWDLAINLFQRVVEALLFFHPVVWWCSRQMRAQREMCCDEAAVAALGNRVLYAKALSHLAEHAALACQPAWALGIGGSKMALLERIRNVLGLGAASHGRWYGPSCALVGAAVASVVWGAVLWNGPSKQAKDVAVAVNDDLPESKNRFPVPVDPEAVTKEFMLGRGANSNAGLTGTIETAPTEHRKTLLPSYTIEPPDILTIDVAHVVPKSPYRLQSGDEVQVIVEPPEANLAARGFFVDTFGRIDLGPPYGEAKVAGLTDDEAADLVRSVVEVVYQGAKVSLTIVQGGSLQPITGEHLVSPDGTVNLGNHGQVLVAGLTVPEAKKRIEEHLSATVDDPTVTLEVYGYNSKVYYVITQDSEAGDMVTRLPVTGNETVLDALSQVKGLGGLADKAVWIARPAPSGGGTDAILPVDWRQITRGAATANNYQVLPGDRIFVADKSSVERPSQGNSHFIGNQR